jgi:type IV secretion system protein VirD4
MPSYQEMDDIVLRVGVYVAAGLAVVALFVLMAGHLSALAFGDGVPRYELADAPGILGRVVTNPGDPGAAWEPVNSGGELPGPLGWWAIFAVLLMVAGAVAFLVYALSTTRPPAGTNRPPKGGWSKPSVHPGLRVQDSEEGRLVIGTGGRSKLAIGRLESLLVVGPAHAGKTSGLAIPALLEWRGPAVVASTKSHLMDETIGWRSHQGDVHVFDPAGVTRYHRSGWPPLSGCRTWQGSIRMAQHFTAAAQASQARGMGGGPGSEIAGVDLWSSAMAMALAPFLYAAAADGRPIMDVAEWIEREERDEVLELLRPIDRTAFHAHETTFFRDDPSRSRFFHLMYQMLSVYGDPTVAATSTKHEIVPAELLDGGRHTLYLTAPEHDQARFQPLFAVIIRQILTEANDRFASKGQPLRPPLLLLLDEAVGVTSVDDLAVMAGSGAAKGVQVVSIFQDLGRFDGMHPDAVGLLAKNHRAMLVLPGERGDSTAAPSTERLLRADLGEQLAPGQAALVYRQTKPVRVRLRRWYKEGELRRRVETAQDAVAPSERRLPTTYRSPLETTPADSLVKQTSTWLRGPRWRKGSSEDPLEQQEGGADRSGETRYGALFEPLEEEPPPDNVTRLPDLGDRSRRPR